MNEILQKMKQEDTDKIFNSITANGCRDMDEVRFNQAVNEILQYNKGNKIKSIIKSIFQRKNKVALFGEIVGNEGRRYNLYEITDFIVKDGKGKVTVEGGGQVREYKFDGNSIINFESIKEILGDYSEIFLHYNASELDNMYIIEGTPKNWVKKYFTIYDAKQHRFLKFEKLKEIVSQLIITKEI